MQQILNILIPVLAVCSLVFFGVNWYLGYKKAKEEDSRRTWIVPITLLNTQLVFAEQTMVATGWARSDYVLNVKDCSEYAAQWIKVLTPLLAPHRPTGVTEWMKQYSFQRDLREDGSNPGRHRVVAIKTSVGMKYIDTYRINGSLYRELSEYERTNGTVI